MDGEIITDAEQREAMRLSQELGSIAESLKTMRLDIHAKSLQPSIDFLASLAWKGSH